MFLSRRLFPIFQNTLPLGFFPFYNHRVLSSPSLPTSSSSSLHLYPHFYLLDLAQESWEIQTSSKGRDDSALVADVLTEQGWECHSPDMSWLCLKCWLPISTAGQFPRALVSLLQSWNLHLLGLYRLKNLKYLLWDRALTKGSIHLKPDATGFHGPACRQTALDKCLFTITAEVSSAFPTSFSLEIRKVKVTF